MRPWGSPRDELACDAPKKTRMGLIAPSRPMEQRFSLKPPRLAEQLLGMGERDLGIVAREHARDLTHPLGP